MKKKFYSDQLKKCGLKVTPQRIALLEALCNLKNHPSADNIKEYIVLHHPNIAVGTIYKTLETFVEKGLINKVKTEKDIMRYDAVLEKHHHLYCENTDEIKDYFDDELTLMLENYFSRKKIPDFEITGIKLQLNGRIKQKKQKESKK